VSMINIPPSKEKFDTIVEEILGRLEYRHLKNDYLDLIERFKQTIEKWISKWLEGKTFNYNDIGDASKYLSNVVIIITIVLIVLLILFGILFLNKILGKNAKVKRIYGELIDEKTTTELLLNKSLKCKENGDYREAIRYGFIAVLVKFNESNILHLDEAMTNGEMINILRKSNFTHLETFEEIVSVFNQVWYGHKDIDEEKYSSWENMTHKLLKGVMSIEEA